MQCPNCHKEVEDGLKFCPGCGHSLAETHTSPTTGRTATVAKILMAIAIAFFICTAYFVYSRSHYDIDSQEFSDTTCDGNCVEFMVKVKDPLALITRYEIIGFNVKGKCHFENNAKSFGIISRHYPMTQENIERGMAGITKDYQTRATIYAALAAAIGLVALLIRKFITRKKTNKIKI